MSNIETVSQQNELLDRRLQRCHAGPALEAESLSWSGRTERTTQGGHVGTRGNAREAHVSPLPLHVYLSCSIKKMPLRVLCFCGLSAYT